MKIYHLALCLTLGACLDGADDLVTNPAENIAVTTDGKADSVGQKLCGNANGLPSNVCRTILEERDADWHHTWLHSAQGTTIQMDHKPHLIKYRDEWTVGSSTYSEERADWTGHPLWFNVSNPAFTGGEHVHAVFAIKRSPDANCNIPEDCGFFDVDFNYVGGGRFTANWQNGGVIGVKQRFIRSDGGTEISTNAEEISVVVDGQWQDDPISHSHNFRFDLGQGLGF